MDNVSRNLPTTRRTFIRQVACAAIGTAALRAMIRDLRFMNAAMAMSTPTDYKALVCIFLAGGNDSNNLVIPTVLSEYSNYATIRTPILAIPLSGAPYNVLPLGYTDADGHGYGLHPSCLELQSLFSANKLAILLNTGTLVYPITRAQYLSKGVAVPPQLFSHADQVTQWQTSIPDQPPRTGWGGRCADLIQAALSPVTPAVSLCISLAGANTFEIGNTVSQYNVSTSGAVTLSGLSSGARLAAVTNVLNQTYPNMQAQAYANVAAHSIAVGQTLNTAIATTADTTGYFGTSFPANLKVINPTSGASFTSSLMSQLKMIARLIEAGHRDASKGGFGMKRQIFFCSVGGYDTHTGQTSGSTPATVTQGAHANLLAELSQSLNAFQSAMNVIAADPNHNDANFAQRVTSFTASDFSRTFPANGVGTDHGWGSHHLILGGAVQGGRTYGKFPALTVNGPDDTGTGRWIPTTAVDQYSATLASWFGLTTSDLALVFPNLYRYSPANLGFMG